MYLSHFSIMGTAVGAYGVEADSDKATFPKVAIETRIGHDKGIKLKVPFIISAMGSTNVAKQNWQGLAIGAALSGTILTLGKRIEEGQIPVYVGRFGDSAEEIFVTAPELKAKYKEKFKQIPTGAIGVYTYFQRLSQGLRQLMAGNRKFALKYITRDDIAALTQDAANISGIP